ncbi:hypothetical protein Loa_02469 [Legionella oakridgensis ATCC 33761 = DSM 21215]|uniref:Uncharacterized protein n=1 Tax=Legionella oakridgensis ATCC 33761 = DSM 21215 TaxID=1268635 RepID=W0BH08_9GAMM|nr:hypothetical protein Loa_02469 [Legionella oakridgensis ATCC 33761 = DSM 21215]ETO92439.1 hypothetical protein LOR_65c17970 [Legionella oakridgensis RV-2-2007]STY21000.1 Uncharacterised protein [Legionella longbeachae]
MNDSIALSTIALGSEADFEELYVRWSMSLMR